MTEMMVHSNVYHWMTKYNSRLECIQSEFWDDFLGVRFVWPGVAVVPTWD